MTAADINNVLYGHFANYHYRLNNTIVFDWESDFFAQSKSGYFVECEVKISRGDFFKDFKKDKHLLFKDLLAKKSHHIWRSPAINTWTADDANLIGKVEIGELRTRYGYGRPWRWSVKNGQSGYYVNDYGNVSIDKRIVDIRAPFTRIDIRRMEQIDCPHQFYYVVPEGLINLSELPPYAGLLYIKSGQCKSIKRAPYLHKRSMDLDKVLLRKYYHLWEYKVPYQAKLDIRKAYRESAETVISKSAIE